MGRWWLTALAVMVTSTTAAFIIGGWLVVLAWLERGSLAVLVLAMLAVAGVGVGMAYAALRLLLPR